MELLDGFNSQRLDPAAPVVSAEGASDSCTKRETSPGAEGKAQWQVLRGITAPPRDDCSHRATGKSADDETGAET